MAVSKHHPSNISSARPAGSEWKEEETKLLHSPDALLDVPFAVSRRLFVCQFARCKRRNTWYKLHRRYENFLCILTRVFDCSTAEYTARIGSTLPRRSQAQTTSSLSLGDPGPLRVGKVNRTTGHPFERSYFKYSRSYG